MVVPLHAEPAHVDLEQLLHFVVMSGNLIGCAVAEAERWKVMKKPRMQRLQSCKMLFPLIYRKSMTNRHRRTWRTVHLLFDEFQTSPIRYARMNRVSLFSLADLLQKEKALLWQFCNPCLSKGESKLLYQLQIASAEKSCSCLEPFQECFPSISKLQITFFELEESSSLYRRGLQLKFQHSIAQTEQESFVQFYKSLLKKCITIVE